MKEWLSPPPEKCDLGDCKIDDFFVDGKTVFGTWACMCPECHEHGGIGFGIGKGQLYWRVGDRWIAILGGSVQERRQ
jgi:hypothetical protein